MHYYAAHLMVFALFVHLISLIVRKAYLRRKWANWLVGMLLFVLTITLSYTGYLLPTISWDTGPSWSGPTWRICAVLGPCSSRS